MCLGVFSLPLRTFTTWSSKFSTTFSNRVPKSLPVCMLRMRFHRASCHCHTCIQVKNAIWVASFLSPTVRCRTLKPTSMMSQPSASQILCDLKEGRKIVIVFYTLPILLNFLYPIYIPVPILPYLSTLCDSTKRGILKDISSYTTRRRDAQD